MTDHPGVFHKIEVAAAWNGAHPSDHLTRALLWLVPYPLQHLTKMSRPSYILTADAFEALTPEAQAEILAVLEPHESRGAAGAPSTPPRGPAGSLVAPGAPRRPARDAVTFSPPSCEDGGEGSPAPPLAPQHNTNDWFYHGRDYWRGEV